MSFRSNVFPAWWWGFSLALVLPLSTLIFLISAPHTPWAAACWTTPVWVLIAADLISPGERRKIPAHAPAWFFDGLLYALAGLQILNILAMGQMVSSLNWEWRLSDDMVLSLSNLVALRILGGTNACCGVIAPAHELTHRRSRWLQILGRVMLTSVFADHFRLAHKVGHHACLGQAEDPSTATQDETYTQFLRRTLLAQWRVAWRHAPKAVYVSLLVQALYLLVFWYCFGNLAAFMLLYQSSVAVRLLEAVNYFQHFGLTRAAGWARGSAWRCDSAVSLFLFLGLTRHSDHHQRPTTGFRTLVDQTEYPALPFGYLITAIWVKNASRHFRKWAFGHGLTRSQGESPEISSDLLGLSTQPTTTYQKGVPNLSHTISNSLPQGARGSDAL